MPIDKEVLDSLKDLYFCGDIHGDYKEFVWTITKRYGLRNAAVVVLGDFGVGFDKTISDLYKWSEKRLKDTNVVIFTIRGNHDDPEYFKEEDKYSFSRLRFMEDHKIYNICGRSIYTVGGANSTDVSYRLSVNQNLAAKGKDRRVWWPGEDIIKKYDDLPPKADIIISHSAPLSFLPVITKFPETPDWQYDNIIAERKYLDYVLVEVKAKYWFYGHYHNDYSGSFGDLLYKGLGIMHFYEAPKIKEENPQGSIEEENATSV